VGIAYSGIDIGLPPGGDSSLTPPLPRDRSLPHPGGYAYPGVGFCTYKRGALVNAGVQFLLLFGVEICGSLTRILTINCVLRNYISYLTSCFSFALPVCLSGQWYGRFALDKA